MFTANSNFKIDEGDICLVKNGASDGGSFLFEGLDFKVYPFCEITDKDSTFPMLSLKPLKYDFLIVNERGNESELFDFRSLTKEIKFDILNMVTNQTFSIIYKYD